VKNRFAGIVLFIAVSLNFNLFAQEVNKECKGRFRWNVKTLTDSAGISLLSESPYDSSISGLCAVDPPVRMFVLSNKDGMLPRFENETYLVKVVAMVTDMNIQKDQDYHIVLRSIDSKASMIGEIPDPDCSYLSDFPDQRRKFRLARNQGAAVYKILKETKKPVKVEVTGVPFWDAPHFWIRGSSKTGREIHPVTGIRILEK
jgi:hypothetical protein